MFFVDVDSPPFELTVSLSFYFRTQQTLMQTRRFLLTLRSRRLRQLCDIFLYLFFFFSIFTRPSTTSKDSGIIIRNVISDTCTEWSGANRVDDCPPTTRLLSNDRSTVRRDRFRNRLMSFRTESRFNEHENGRDRRGPNKRTAP